MSEAMRQEFEAWVQQDSTLPVTRDEHGCTDFTTGLLWHTWQAAKTKAPEGASEGVNRANTRPSLAVVDYTCAHDFAVQPSSGIKLCQTCGLSETAARNAVPQQAAPVVGDDLRDRLVAISAAIADQDDQGAQAMLREILAAPQQVAPATQQADEWIERWYGSGGKDGYEGWSIVHAKNRSLIAYLGRDVDSDAVTDLVEAHNTAARAWLNENGGQHGAE